MSEDPRVEAALDAWSQTPLWRQWAPIKQEQLKADMAAALSAASPPAQGGVVVRAAVAMTENGDYSVVGGSNLTDAQAMDDAVGSHGGDIVHRAAILTATIPAPVVPEIAAAVTAEGEE